MSGTSESCFSRRSGTLSAQTSGLVEAQRDVSVETQAEVVVEHVYGELKEKSTSVYILSKEITFDLTCTCRPGLGRAGHGRALRGRVAQGRVGRGMAGRSRAGRGSAERHLVGLMLILLLLADLGVGLHLQGPAVQLDHVPVLHVRQDLGHRLVRVALDERAQNLLITSGSLYFIYTKSHKRPKKGKETFLLV